VYQSSIVAEMPFFHNRFTIVDLSWSPVTRDRLGLRLSTSKNQKALNLSFAEAVLVQQLSATVKRELGHDNHGDIVDSNSCFVQEL
jgi:hypothetical protein